MRKLLATVAVVVWGVQALAAVLEEVEISGDLAQSKVTIKITEPANFHHATLPNPPRLYVDLNDTAVARNFVKSTEGTIGVQQVRIGVHPGNRIRVVVDLGGSFRTAVSSVPVRSADGYAIEIGVFHADVERQCATLPTEHVVVLLDPGHGGFDPGAVGYNEVLEKDVTFAIATHIEESLGRKPGFKVILTRTGDYAVPLEDRRKLAEDMQADIFISIHADAYGDQAPHGASVYVLSEDGTESELDTWLVQNESSSDWEGGISNWVNSRCFKRPRDLLFLNYRSQQEAFVQAVKLGESVLKALDIITYIRPNKKKPTKDGYSVHEAGFKVLKATAVPTILVEAGFLSNPNEAQLLGTVSYRRSVGHAVANAIRNFFCANPPPHTLLAKEEGACSTIDLTYTAQHGETLRGIATRNAVSLDRLVQANNAAADERLQAGHLLAIPNE